MKQTIEQGAVFEKEFTKIFIDCENTMAVCDIDQLKGHTGGTFHGIFVAAGRAKTAMTAEGNKFETICNDLTFVISWIYLYTEDYKNQW